MASRLESASKIYNLEILISNTIFDDLKNPKEYCIRDIDMVRVKGEEEVLTLYEVFDCDDEETKLGKIESKSIFYKGLEHYRSANFKEASQNFECCLEICPKDPIPKLYIKRCSTLMRLPKSDNWEGVSGI